MIDRQLAHYRITAPLGAGGMGEVYRADDQKLGRQVAIKLLPESMAQDPERLARFEREARALAQLNHPNIGAIYGLEEADGVRFLVLELVEGETLAKRIERGPVPVVEAIEIARQIAEALGEAHAAGILHRDLKPANVKVTPDGKVKVLDFGLAKPFQPDAASGDVNLSLSPTLTFGGTQAGMLMGTAAYMSPEQARGHAVDKRSDIWAFGVVLFELLTGRRMFAGGTVSDTLASVLKEEPPWQALPRDTPPAARRLLRRTLARNRAARLHDIADAGLEIDEALAEAAGKPIEDGSAAGASTSASVAMRVLPWMLAALAIPAAAWFGLAPRSAPAAPLLPRLESTIALPADQSVDLGDGMALSADGRQLAYVTLEADGTRTLWVRSLERGALRRIEAKNVSAPFWSPDGRYLAYFEGDTIKKIELATGAVETLAQGIPSTYGGAWNGSGDILFASSWNVLRRIGQGGGPATDVTAYQGNEDSHAWPEFLPDGRHFLFLGRAAASNSGAGVRIGSLDGEPVRDLFPSLAAAEYADPGFLVWWSDGNLKAQRFDPDRLELTGEPRVIASGVGFDPRSGLGAFALSRNGVLVYREGTDQQPTELVWLDRQGNHLSSAGPPGNYYTPRLARDGRRIAVDISDAENNGDIWILDPTRGTRDRITTEPANETGPIWSPDGKELLYLAARDDNSDLRIVATRAGPEPRTAFFDPERNLFPGVWLPDGTALVTDRKADPQNLMVVTLADGTITPYRPAGFSGRDASVSPDGHWIAYTSKETGAEEVFLETHPEPGDRWRVSTAGGSMPLFGPDGRELFYVDPTDQLLSVPLTPGANPDPGMPRPLFRVDVKAADYRQYDTVDGQRFLVNVELRPEPGQPLTMVVGWEGED